MAKKDKPLTLEDLIAAQKKNKTEMSESIRAQLEAAQNAEQTAEEQLKTEEEVLEKQSETVTTLQNVESLLKVISSNIENILDKLKAPVDQTESEIENGRIQTDQLKLLQQIADNTAGKSKPEEGEDDNSKSKEGGWLSGLGKTLKGMGSGMAGWAKNILALSASLWILAKALQEFSKVQWMSIVKGAAAMTTLAIAAKFAGSGDAHKSILALGVGALALAYGLTKFADVEWENILKGAAAMIALGIAARVAGSGDAYKSILALGVGTIGLAYGLNKFGEVSWENILTGAAAMLVLAGAAKLAGSGDAARSILALGIGTIGLAYGLNKFGDVSWGNIIKGSAVLLALGAAAKLAGTGPSALGMLALSASVYILALALDKFANISWESIAKGALVIGGLAVAAEAFTGALVGAAAMAIVAGSVWLLADAFEKFGQLNWGDIGKGLAAIVAIGVVAMAAAAALPLLLLGAVGIGAIGLALMSMGVGLSLINESGGFDTLTEGLAALGAVGSDGGLLLAAAGIIALGTAIAVFAGAQMLAAVSNLVSNFLSLGDDSPVEQLLKIADAAPGINQAADAMERLAAAMISFGGVDEDALDAAVDAAEDIADAFDSQNVVINLAGPNQSATQKTQAAPANTTKPVSKAPMTKTDTSTYTESVSGTLSGVTGEQIRNHPNYKKYYDESMKAYNDPIVAREDATDRVKEDMVKEQQGSVKKVTPSSAKTVYNKSAEADAAKNAPVEVPKNTTIVNNNQVNNQNQNNMFKSKVRNDDSTVMGYIKNRLFII